MERPTASEGTRIILVRHGQTVWNRDRRVQGHTDTPLDAVGKRQAARLAPRLAGEPIVATHASDLSRAVETAAPVAAALGQEVRTWRELRELCYGPWEGLTVLEIERRYPDAYRRWREDNLRFRFPGIEPVEALYRRAMVAGREILAAHDGRTSLIVAHGGSLRALICGLLGWPVAVARQLRLDNASISCIEYAAHGPLLVLFNDVGHLIEEQAEPIPLPT